MVACVDGNEAVAVDFQRRFGFEEHATGVDELIGRPDVHAFVIATSNDTHKPLTIQAANAGKHVLVQKPMAPFPADAKEMVDAAEKAGTKLMVALFLLFLPPVERAKQIIDAGLIGTPFLYKATMGWHMPDMVGGKPNWRHNSAMSGGGVIQDDDVHHIANALYLLDNPEIMSVYSEYGALTTNTPVEDTAVTILRTPTAICEITGSNRLHEPGGSKNFKDDWQIFGTEGAIRWDAAQRPTLRVYTHRDDATDPLLSDGWICPRVPAIPEDQRAYSNHMNGEESPWVPLHQHFVDACLKGTPIRSDGRYGWKVQQVVEAAYKSGREGRRVSLAE